MTTSPTSSETVAPATPPERDARSLLFATLFGALLAALIIFRLFYLLIPFALSLVVVLLFERARLAQAWRGRVTAADGSVPPPPLSSSDQ